MITFGPSDYKGMCADMHFHTNHSDGAATVAQTLEKIDALGIWLAITDHNEISGSLEAEHDRVIPGIEVSSKEGIDILFYFQEKKQLKRFFEKEIKPNRKRYKHRTTTTISLSRLHELSMRYGDLVVVAHPFGYSLRGKGDRFSKHESILKNFDAYEAINGGNSRAKNEASVKYIKDHEKLFTGGSDGHSIYAMGRVVTCADAENLHDFFDAIKKKKNWVRGVETRFGKYGEAGNFVRNKVRNLFR